MGHVFGFNSWKSISTSICLGLGLGLGLSLALGLGFPVWFLKGFWSAASANALGCIGKGILMNILKPIPFNLNIDSLRTNKVSSGWGNYTSGW